MIDGWMDDFSAAIVPLTLAAKYDHNIDENTTTQSLDFTNRNTAEESLSSSGFVNRRKFIGYQIHKKTFSDKLCSYFSAVSSGYS